MGQLGLALSYVFPLALLAWLWLDRRRGRKTRWMILALLPAFYLGHWLAIGSLSGWPSDRKLPPHFELVAAATIEPDHPRGEAGKIYLWIRQNLHAKPRAHTLPYSRELHELIHTATRKLAQGTRQQGTIRGRETSGNSASMGNGLYLIIDDATQRVLPAK